MNITCLSFLLAAAVTTPAAAPALTGFAAAWEPDPVVSEAEEPSLHFDRGGVHVREESLTENNAVIQRRAYALYNGDRVETGRAQANGATGSLTVTQTGLPASDGTVRWFDPASGTWQAAPLSERTIRFSCAVVTLENGGEALFYTPKVYQSLGSGTLRHLPNLDGSLELRRTGGGWTVCLTVPSLPAGCAADYTLVTSPERLFTGPEVLNNFWCFYTQDGDGKWCYDGYYYPSPSTYTPSGENCYYRLTAAYLCKSFVDGAPQVRAADDLAAVTLDIMSRQQNQLGYFPTLPVSQWLANSYGISGGFYDTRFNTDLAEIYLQYAQQNPCTEFDAVLNRYFDFYLTLAAAHHRETTNGGWLVDDYWNPSGGAATHTSLNHQLAEILALYHAADYLERGELRELAERMLQGIEDTAGNWVRYDSNLWYAFYRNSGYSGEDYPYLTYNDLYDLRAFLGHGTPAIDRLMQAKQAWMDANGITEYKKD